MSHWNSVSDSGILRKTAPIENHDELLVFGYACKLFKDDEKATYIDQGKHLIPWMGDQKLKIDRYDCRGALSDLNKYEASKEGYDATRWLGLSDKERQLEELCDNERYYSLKINEEEEEMYKEEDLKRKTTNTIHYSYDVPQNPELDNDGIPTVAEEDEVEEEYIPPPILDVPVDIQMPATVKENARIEKTALFVSKQGLQMEILLKAKQAGNPQFSFLNQGDPLFKFYRHVLAAFKNGRYQGYVSNSEKHNDELNNSTDLDSSSHYLHPSLSSSNLEPIPPTAVTIPQIQYKPSVNCSYSQLVSRIQGSQNDGEVQKTTAAASADFSHMSYEQQQQYYQYFYSQQYYEYYKQLAAYQHGQGSPGQFVPPPDIPNLDPNMQAYLQQIAYQQYLQHQANSNSSYAQIVSNISKDANGYTPQLAQQGDPGAPIVYGPEPKPQEDERKVTIVKDQPELVAKKPLLCLADYGSASESDSDGESEEDKKEVYKVPTGEMLVIIDKMAVYVSKNGEQFENIVKAKKDPRFEFLNDDNEYNKYYREKIRELKGEVSVEEETKVDEEKKGDEEKGKDVKVAKKEKKVIAPVSFSIKKAKEDPPKELKSALPVEESDDEEESETPVQPPTEIPSPNTDVPKPPVTTVLVKSAENHQKPESENIVDIRNSPEKDKIADTPAGKEIPKCEENVPKIKPKQEENIFLVEDDPILEMIELTDDNDDDKKDNRAEDVKNRLSSAAKERALQMERKRKAAAFLKLKTAGNKMEKPGNSSESISDVSPDKTDRRMSIEIIEIDDESPPKKNPRVEKRRRDRSKSPERGRSGSKDGKRRKEKKKDKKHKSREKRRRSDSFEREEEENSKRRNEEDSRRRDEERRERKKKSHKRKHSKTKKKHKRRSKHSDSDKSHDVDSSS